MQVIGRLGAGSKVCLGAAVCRSGQDGCGEAEGSVCVAGGAASA